MYFWGQIHLPNAVSDILLTKYLQMKNISFLLICFFFSYSLFSQQKGSVFSTENYVSDWQKIEEMEGQGLPKSALELVNTLLLRVKKENNPAQLVKCILKREFYLLQTTESGTETTILHLQQEIKAAASPTKEILQSALADIVHRYYSEHLWELSSRTKLENESDTAVESWSAEKLINTSNQYYLSSISNTKYLQSLDIKYFLAILNEGNEESDKLRPTLFNLLAHRAVDYFMDDQSNLSKPADAFVMKSPAYFDLPLQLRSVATPSDSSSCKWQALRIFEQLEKIHAEDSDPTALLDVVLKRFNYVKQHLFLADRDKLYLQALENVEKKYPKNDFAAEFLFKRAEYYYNEGQRYDASNPKDERKLFFQRALEFCNLCALKYPKSAGNLKCINLTNSFRKPELSLQCELVNVPKKPILVKINYKNTGKFYVKVIKRNAQLENSIDELRGKAADLSVLNLLNEQPVLYTQHFETKPDADFRAHSTEIMLEAKFQPGKYFLMVADSSSFDSRQTQYAPFSISGISCISRSGVKGDDLIVTDRETGKPLANVLVNAFTEVFNDKSGKYEKVLQAKYRTDKNGMATLNLPLNTSYSLVLSKGKDTLEMNRYFYRQQQNRENNGYESTFFFMDRAIYRPGQQIYFKGLALRYDQNHIPQILKNQAVKVVFRDANYSIIDSLSLKSNDFGTFSGTFTAPSGSLMGSMSIGSSVGKTEKYFRVEEYKRPKFEASFIPVKGSYQLNDEIAITGTATAFAGNKIDGAKVKYRVVREVNYPYWGYWCWWRPLPSSSAMEISSGETNTNSSGEFEVKFKAIPDEKSDPNNKPQFTYTVTAEVIDISGETHSARSSVTVSEILVNINVDVPELNSIKSLKKIKIRSTNLAGEKEPTLGYVRIAKLADPAVNYHNRKWSLPDMPIIPENVFKKNFPQLAYAGEDQIQNRKVEKEVYSGLYDNSESDDYSLNKIQWEAGTYMIVLNSKDKNNMGIEIREYFSVYDAESKSIPYSNKIFTATDKKSYEPGQVAKIFLGNKGEKLNVLFEIENRTGKIVSSKWLNIEDMQTMRWNISEADRGNISYRLSYVKDNRFYQSTETIVVPWSNKDLNIEYITFRDMTLPGSKEEWRVRISGPKREKVAAEMVAAMYDASLDQFAANTWELPKYPLAFPMNQYSGDWGFDLGNSVAAAPEFEPGIDVDGVIYRQLNIGLPGYSPEIAFRGGRPMYSKYAPSTAASRAINDEVGMKVGQIQQQKISASALEGKREGKKDFSDINPRTNLKETVFFMPNLMTDAGGNIILSFTMNEALTRWKFLGMAHSADLQMVLTEKEIVTQKRLMVQPNAPRFFREGDEIEFTSKVVNLTDSVLSGSAKLKLNDALNGKALDWQQSAADLPFSVNPGQSGIVSWKIRIPSETSNAVTWTVSASAGEHSDAESNSLPVISNRMLVTETMPLPVRAGQSKDFHFDALKKASGSSTLQSKNLSLEFTANPAWYAVQALPYMMENEVGCIEHLFSRYYANSLATSILKANPNVKKVFDRWKTESPGKGPESALMQNEELKSALLKETPWVMQSGSEALQKQNIAKLFDLKKMADELSSTIDKLAKSQLNNGGFSWFPGGNDSWYITQYLLEGFGHLKKLSANIDANPNVELICEKALNYVDEKFLAHYNELQIAVAKGYSKWEDDHLDPMVLHYLYTRSFFKDVPKKDALVNAETYYLGQAKKYWTSRNIYEQGLMALTFERFNDAVAAHAILRSLKERAITNEESGMYWKLDQGYFWHQRPVETQALMIEVFQDVAKDSKAVDNLKTWLLKNKQTNQWENSKATASAVYALLMSKSKWLDNNKDVKFSFNGRAFEGIQNKEAGTGYFKTTLLNASEPTDKNITVENFATIKVENPNDVVAWGAMYWQYMEQLDKITSFKATPMKIEKKLFVVENSANGQMLKPIDANTKLKTGDLLKVRVELRVDRDMEFVHMKDMRAAGLEPVNVLSSYKWQGGLGYYESTGDFATNFYFDFLPKGSYVFEYPLRANLKGEFSNGITTLQCMYAPEFSSHSEGIKLKIE